MSQDKQNPASQTGDPQEVKTDFGESGDSVEPPSTSSQPLPDDFYESSPTAPHGCHIEVFYKVEQPTPAIKGWLKPKLEKILPLAGVDRGDINILIVDDEMMSVMHERYKGVGGTTDVLSFDMRESDNDPVEADLVVCLDEAVRQAKHRGHTTREEVLLYTVHGLLHMLGYDDHDEDEATLMHQKEDELLAAVGIGPIFNKVNESM